MHKPIFLVALSVLWVFAGTAAGATLDWLDQHRVRSPQVDEEGVCTGTVGALPSFTVRPIRVGSQLVRVSLPFAPGTLPVGLGINATARGQTVPVDLRVVTRHPGQPPSVRRGMITFLFDFVDDTAHAFHLQLVSKQTLDPLIQERTEDTAGLTFRTRFGQFQFTPGILSVVASGGTAWTARLIAPEQHAPGEMVVETVESGAYFAWIRLLAPDASWPRILELRVDAAGGIALWAHIQRLEPGNSTAGDLGWHLSGLPFNSHARHTFAKGEAVEITTRDGKQAVRFPRAPFERRGYVEATEETLRFLRCEASEQVPFQSSAWRSAAITLDPVAMPRRNALLENELEVRIAPETFDILYESGVPIDVQGYWPLDRLLRFTRCALVRSMAMGDDFGNVTGYTRGLEHGSAYGMNRLNHCPAIFEEAWRSGDRSLRDTALLWCRNMHDLSIWWGHDDAFGGTRYNNAGAAGEQEHANDPNFMWRTNNASTFCTKGFDSFFLAYEETGDPAMLAALDAQVRYARQHVHVHTGEARNIGIVADFMALYRYTGLRSYLEDALRLFEELRLCVGEDYLFSQNSKPIEAAVPFIDDDARGYATPFGKPYIMGYALSGLPALLRTQPDVYQLLEVVRAVTRFMAESQDPLGGWRYPHPRSSSMILDQAMEHTAQLARAGEILEERDEPITPVLDAIERALRARLAGYLKSGTILTGLGGWEKAAGLLANKSIYDLYQNPDDRDATRDYSEGAIYIDSSCPEGLAHSFETLAFYVQRRPVERLFHHGSPLLNQVIARMPARQLEIQTTAPLFPLHVAWEGSPLGTLTISGREGFLFPGQEFLRTSTSPNEVVGNTSNDTHHITFHVKTFPDMAEFALSVFPKVPGHTQEATIEVVLSLEEISISDLSYGGSVAEMIPVADKANRPTTLSFVFPMRTSSQALGVILPNGIAWERLSTGMGIRAMLRGVLRGDGPTTFRGFLVIDLSEETVQATLAHMAERIAVGDAHPTDASPLTANYGMRAKLPAFHESRIERLVFPLAWRNADMAFTTWRQYARDTYREALLPVPPAAPFAPKVLAVEDRGAYEARKIAFNISVDERVCGYLLVPKGEGPFPAILALHDHGAHFTIGKEKVVRPIEVSDQCLSDAQAWVDKYYGGQFIGDVLASRGYVVFATDALYWGDRGRYEGADYASQQELAANLLQLGQSWAGIIVWDDLRSAQFLQGQPEVIPERIGCIGLSMGAHRTWNLCALTDIISAGAAICWMGDTPTLLREGNNQTRGQSAFSMIHPGLRNVLDYADVASIACPKPMLFYNGAQDLLFPVPGVKAAYAVLHHVWREQGVAHLLETKLWDVPHEFNQEMQEAAFSWLDTHLR